MGRNRKPRKAYRPRAVVVDPVEHAIAMAAVPPASTRASLIGPMRDALDRLRRGQGTPSAWDTLADAHNVSLALMDAQIAPDHRATVTAGCRALRALSERVNAGASWTLRADELRALQDACEIHEVQLEVASQREIRDAILQVQRTVRGVLEGNASPRVSVACIGALGRPAEAATC